jgi:hypothetical protein|tara:strand:- start:26 stop:337 length:312 start_codon:yes stop_codon:yes gene_type:complete
MNKLLLISIILLLIIVTTITKNSTEKIENKIFSVRENISALQDKYEFVLLEYNFLSSPKKLLEYQLKYFEEDLISIDINKIKEINIRNNEFIIKNFNKIKNND